MPESLPVSDPTDVCMGQRIDSRLTSSGQPTEEQISAIKALGVTHIVNLGLHTHEKALPDEAGSVSSLGMTYIHIPVDFDKPTEADFDRFQAAMQDLEGKKIHVHCIANLRVSAFLCRYRRDQRVVSQGDARAEMERVWRPGGVWASFTGNEPERELPHRYAGRDY